MPAVLIPPSVVEAAEHALVGASGELRVVSIPCDVDPLTLVRAAAPAFGRAGYFGMPGGVEIGGAGVAWRVTAAGPDRLESLSAGIGAAKLPPEARLLMGFAFAAEGPRGGAWDGFPAAAVVLPALAAVRTPSGGRVVLAVPAGADPAELLATLGGLEVPPPPRLVEGADVTIESRPAPAVWREAVAETVAAIRADVVTKVVLTREVVVRSEAANEPFGLVAHLRARHPRCYAFGWQEGSAVFVGASPELLVARSGDTVRSQPLAGTAPRGTGEDDGLLGRRLLFSDKERNEHRLVVDDIAARLRPLTLDLSVQTEPTLRRFVNVQHLGAEISGRLAIPRTVIDLAAELHPTPAVGGTPRGDALTFIEKVEAYDRGWYTGGLGWCEPGGDGEVAVALRCALLRAGAAHLYAGSGIVAGSDPEAELVETRLKLRPLLDLLAVS